MEEKKSRSLFWQTYGKPSSGKNEADLSQFSDEALDDCAGEMYPGEEDEF